MRIAMQLLKHLCQFSRMKSTETGDTFLKSSLLQDRLMVSDLALKEKLQKNRSIKDVLVQAPSSIDKLKKNCVQFTTQ